MPRVNIKGGVWKNTEDEILKAAVMKYGKNQWSRIASLLHRKSAKQCKARWFEWLDPSIKKTEWSREEEEKLLHLAKLMPTQWRTIAPLVGRTAAQCLEHYEYLLDQAQKKDGDVDDARRLRPGEIDPCPETKPARPDPIDMDEDEKEMLAEARARLANTQGKKAKRKAREKQLEEARRLATLQKRRELQAAGIEVKKKRLKRGLIDYNREIPFEKKPALGFYDTSEEAIDVNDPNFKKLRLHDIDEKRRDEEEAKERHKDSQKLEKRQEGDAPGVVKQLNHMNMASANRKRSKLVLPAPQINEAELEEVVKMGRTSENIAFEASSGGEASNMLLSNYSFQTPSSAGMRTPRTPATGNSIMTEAKNMLALTNVETPLKGGVNTPVTEVDFSAATPSSKALATPNTVLGTPVNKSDFSATPKINGSATPMSVRDQLSINRNDGIQGEVNVDEHENKMNLKQGLSSLPAPQNDFEIVLPEDEAQEVAEKKNRVDDQEVVDEMTAEERRRKAEEEWKRESQVIQRSLPRPLMINAGVLRSTLGDMQLSALQTAEEKIKEEMVSLMRHDSKKYPNTSKTTTGNLTDLPIYTDEELEEARAALKKEIETVRKGMNHGDLSLDAYTQVWEECYREVMFNVSQSRYTRASMSSKKDRIEYLEKTLDTNRQQMTKEAKKAAKIEKKLKIILGGYQAKSLAITKQIEDINDQLDQVYVEDITYSRLRQMEQEIIPHRLGKLQEHVQRQTEREAHLQERYKQLLETKRQIQIDIDKLDSY